MATCGQLVTFSCVDQICGNLSGDLGVELSWTWRVTGI